MKQRVLRMLPNIKQNHRKHVRLAAHASIALFVAVSSLAPFFMYREAGAAQLTNRSVNISSAVPNATGLTYTYSFTTQTSATIQSIELEMCTSAIIGTTCTPPAGCTGGANNCVNAGTEASRSGWNTTTPTTFVRNATGAGGCAPANNVLCLDRTDTDSETAGARTLGWNTQRNPNTPNTTFFMRITLYSDSAWATTVDSGTVASSTSQTLEVSAYVAEVLNFCVGSTSIDNGTSSVGAACANISGTTVNIGVLEDGVTNVSPVTLATYNGNNLNGVAMIRSNAINGATVSYKSIQQTGTNQLGTLRIAGASCSATVTDATDGCIQAQGTTQGALDAGAATGDRFGMTIAAINPASTTSYSCTFAAGTCNLVRDANYDGTGANTYPTTDINQVTGATAAGYAWDDSGTSDEIASSTGSASKVIDDEAMILKFAAYSAITTPFGTYTAQADFIALATY